MTNRIVLYVMIFAVALTPHGSADEAIISLEGPTGEEQEIDLALLGVSLIPHVKGEGLEYYPKPDGPLGARIQFFVYNAGPDSVRLNEVHFDDSYPFHHQLSGDWSWRDTPNLWPNPHRELPVGALSVWTVNAVRPTWREGKPFELRVHDWRYAKRYRMMTDLRPPRIWLAAVTFLGDEIRPDQAVIHIDNRSDQALRVKHARIWQPKTKALFRALYPSPIYTDLEHFHPEGIIKPGDMGGFTVSTGPLMLSYAAVEVLVENEQGESESLWGYLRVKREVFDIAGGWIGGAASDGRSALLHEPFLKALKRLHVDSGHIGVVQGYNDAIGEGGLYDDYPIKHFHSLTPISRYDVDEMMPHIHAAEFLGEPQLPFSDQNRLPQQVWEAFQPYAPTRIPTTITLSDEAGWRHYAGLSDYPHYDAYRVIAPHADPWRRYDRWEDGVRIGWGSPLETISEMSRVLRELSRPAPTAIWSQGPHTGWFIMDGRTRLSPTADELLSQAYFALSTRITSLYWFNLSVGSLTAFRDTLEPMTRIGRETRMLESFYLRGAAYRHETHTKAGRPDWELAAIAAPHGALLFACDLDYSPDPYERVFKFGEPREVVFNFALPAYLREPVDVFRVDADGARAIEWEATRYGVRIIDKARLAAMYVAAPDGEARRMILDRRDAAIAAEEALGFDPANNDADFAQLEAIAP